jgi:retinol-binding protein 3
MRIIRTIATALLCPAIEATAPNHSTTAAPSVRRAGKNMSNSRRTSILISMLVVTSALTVQAEAPQVNTLYTVNSVNSNAPIGAFQLRIDTGVRARVVRAIAEQLDQLYVYPEVGKKLALDITSVWKQGQYNAVTDGFAFAQQLTDRLQAVSHDKHLRVDFSPAQLPKGETGLTSASVAQERERLRQQNCGFVRVEWLSGNVGYVRFDEFGDDAAVCTCTAVAAMGFLANVDAIIFDLRENHGGDPALVAFLETYLFASRTHIDDLWDRRSGRTTEIWTLPDVPGKRIPSAAAYVLTSHGTFSGAEAFAYELQALKRATVVGEVTGGGGHIVHGVRVDDRFRLMIPVARPINPVTKTNWEGTGVTPDVNVPAAQALDVARGLATEELTRRRADHLALSALHEGS